MQTPTPAPSETKANAKPRFVTWHSIRTVAGASIYVSSHELSHMLNTDFGIAAIAVDALALILVSTGFPTLFIALPIRRVLFLDYSAAESAKQNERMRAKLGHWRLLVDELHRLGDRLAHLVFLVFPSFFIICLVLLITTLIFGDLCRELYLQFGGFTGTNNLVFNQGQGFNPQALGFNSWDFFAFSWLADGLTFNASQVFTWFPTSIQPTAWWSGGLVVLFTVIVDGVLFSATLNVLGVMLVGLLGRPPFGTPIKLHNASNN